MIVCGFEDVREHKPAVSGKNPVHPVHRCESKIYPCLTMNRFPATRRRRLFQVSVAPAPHDGVHHSEEKQPFVNEDEPPMNTNEYEEAQRQIDLLQRQLAPTYFCTLSRWCDPVMGGSPPGSAGVPPAQILIAASAISSTGINRQRRPASASAGPMRFPPAGRSAATSQGN